MWAENLTDGGKIACCTSGTGEQLIRTNLARELCHLDIAQHPDRLPCVIEDTFLKSSIVYDYLVSYSAITVKHLSVQV